MIKNNDDFIAILSTIKPDIKPLESYVNRKTKIEVMCKTCGHKWRASPNSLLNKSTGNGCPNCAHRNITKSHKQYLEEANNINPNIQVVGEYKNSNTKIKVKCLVNDCGYEWNVYPNNILKGHGCPKCAGQVVEDIKYDLSGEYGIGWTANTNKPFIFDLEDYDKICNYRWYELKSTTSNYSRVYAKVKSGEEWIYLHTVIAGEKNIDHEDRDTFNNRKSNLRKCSQANNTRNSSKRSTNTSGFIGVGFDKRRNKWIAEINYNNQHIFCGYYSNKEDAVIARLNAELKYFGPEFAPQRHLFDQYNITMR